MKIVGDWRGWVGYCDCVGTIVYHLHKSIRSEEEVFIANAEICANKFVDITNDMSCSALG